MVMGSGGLHPEEMGGGTGAAGITGGGNHDRSTVFDQGFDEIMFASQMLPICRTCGNKAPLVFCFFCGWLMGFLVWITIFKIPWGHGRDAGHTHSLCAVFLGFSA